jgi:Tol biopolymer transport system component
MKAAAQREPRHALLVIAALLLPLLGLVGCESAVSGHAPGVAGGETTIAGTTNFPLAYVKRPIPPQDIDVRDLITSVTGGDLYVRTQASADGTEINVTKSITMGMGDVRDLDASVDGTKLVFALRLPLNPQLSNTDPKQPNWHIYQYDALAQTVTQLTNDDIEAGHDVGPHYLPDGRIVFSSTRQTATQAILLDEGRPQYAAQTDNRQSPIFLLHVMNADGTNIHQISFNTNHDFAPSVLNNGQIVFSRWEVTNGTDQISLYRANPDGTGLELYYGANSHATGANLAGTNDNVIQFLSARQRPDGKLLAIDRPFLGTQQGGDALLIDADDFVEIHQPATPDGAPGTGQASATLLGITTDANLPSPGGRFYSAYPLYDGTDRMLVSWSPCLVQDGAAPSAAVSVCNSGNTTGANVQMAPPQYTLWLYDLQNGTLSPVLSAAPGMMIVEPVILQARVPVPTYIPDSVATTTAQQNLVSGGVGTLNITSVYDVDGADTAVPDIAAVSDPAQQAFYTRPYRFIRIVHAVEIPDREVRKINPSAFGPANMGMREILGYAPIQPDGSVQIQVPANVPFTIDLLDANAQRISSLHTTWLQLIPGETRTCNGCHSTAKKTSHGRSGLTAPVYHGAPAGDAPFPHTNPALIANAGETMAALLARLSCVSSSPIGCTSTLSSDVIYTNTWTTGVTLLAGETDPDIDYLYSNLNTPAPLTVPASCSPTWTAQCRATTHYPIHIQPVWVFPRQTLAADGVTVLSDHTCVLCHNTASAMNSLQVPAGQIDLTGGTSTVDPTVVTSYEELLFPHDAQTLNMGELQNTLVPAPGPPNPTTGLPTTIMVPVSVAPPMTAGSAIGSAAFFGVFGNNGSHYGYLTPAELRLISEWLDIGGQYYNDPFVAPAAN